MKMGDSFKTAKTSAATRAEAAAWVARLHGPKRNAGVESGWRRWMDENPAHAAAFELMTDTWEKSARLRRRPLERVASWEFPGLRISFSRALLGTAMVALLAVIGTVLYLHSDEVVTAVGEQRTLTLEDGTRVSLNTDTRVRVHYDKAARQVELESGEALFEVAKRPDWPFIVTAAHRHIKALGTEFLVRRDERKLMVTLVEGKVTVSPVTVAPTGGSGAHGSAAPVAPPTRSASSTKPAVAAASQATFTLVPGQRLTFASSGAPILDRPPLERITAWKRGQVLLDNTRLSEAVREMNRYSTLRLIVEDVQVGAIPISGTFQAGDSENFAKAIARTYHLQVRNQLPDIVLVGKPPGVEATPEGNEGR